MKEFGLIGHPLSHSFSKSYFEEKFREENLEQYFYHLFDILNLKAELPEILQGHPHLVGLNVTIPYKEQIIPLLTALDESAQKVGAVNVIKVNKNQLIGYNSDYYGFRTSLIKWLNNSHLKRALVLGSGGASKAVVAALNDLDIEPTIVSRKPTGSEVSYEDLYVQKELISASQLIVNTSPVGMHPNEADCPDIPYDLLTASHWLYDLVYNPEVTSFMRKGAAQGARIKNGLDMLHLQAEKSWEIWSA